MCNDLVFGMHTVLKRKICIETDPVEIPYHILLSEAAT